MIESFLTLFAFGAFGFWALAGIFSIVLLVCLENDKGGLAFFSTVVVAGLLWKTISHFSPMGVVFGCIAYLLIGAVWSIVKWKSRVASRQEEFEDRLANYESKGDRQFDDLAINEMQSTFSRQIKVSSNKSEITLWMAYWPWSVIWALTNDLFKAIYRQLKNVYESIANKALDKSAARVAQVKSSLLLIPDPTKHDFKTGHSPPPAGKKTFSDY